jgi:hypothetical protein
MTEETTQDAPTEQAPAEAPQTLESLYNEYNVQPQAQEPVQPQQPVTTEPQPDPNDGTAIQQEISMFRQELAAERQRTAAKTDEADFSNAVATLSKDAGLEGKDTMIKGFLIAKASEDQRLRTIWEKRTSNPQAWDKALKILADEVKDNFKVPNPQLEENQRAMEESQRAQSSTAPPTQKPEEDLMRMNNAEFSHYWGRLAGRG